MQAVEADDLAVLVLVLTGRSEREFVFYLDNEQEFLRRLSSMPQEAERYPIKIHKNEDPQWVYFDREMEGLNGTNAKK